MRPLPTGEPWGDYAVSTARWTGALLHEVLAQARPVSATASTSGSRAPTTAPTTSSRSCPETDQDDLTFVRALPLGPGRRPRVRDPHRLRDERPAPRARPRRPVPPDRAALVRRRVGEVAQADRRPHRAVHRRVPDRPLHVPVARPAPRARQPHAGPRPDHRPAHPGRPSTSGTYTVRGKAWSGTGPDHPRRGQPHRRRRLAPGAARTARAAPTTGRTGPSPGTPPTSADTPCAPEPPTPPATCNPTYRRGTASATATTPSRSSTSTSAATAWGGASAAVVERPVGAGVVAEAPGLGHARRRPRSRRRRSRWGPGRRSPSACRVDRGHRLREPVELGGREVVSMFFTAAARRAP